MVKSGHRPFSERQVAYQNERRPSAQLEMLDLAELVKRIPSDDAFERLDFHIWAFFTAGRCSHVVDFETFDCRPGSVLHVRPGQVHRWDTNAKLRGFVLLLTPVFTPPVPSRQKAELLQRVLDDDTRSPLMQVAAPKRAAVERWLTLLEQSAANTDESTASTELLRHLVAVTLLEAYRSSPQPPPASTTPIDQARMQQFKLDLERSFRVTRSVGDYAKALGVAAKTLDRTAREMTGVSAKDFIDARVVLEAKRYCVHSAEPIERIADLLGFSEATNFVKFFKARVGSSPGSFRARLRSSSH